jgi:carbon monoxide dehydrogenase subunit G
VSIKLQNEISVAASPEATYALLVDVERVAPCIPGAEIVERRADGSYDAEMRMRLGPMNLTFAGTVAIAERDDARLTAVLIAKAQERRGRGAADATMTMQVRDGDGGGAAVDFGSDIAVTGKVAQMGHGVMADVATRMIDEMAKALEAALQRASTGQASPSEQTVIAAKPPSALKLLFGALRDGLARRLRRLRRR